MGDSVGGSGCEEELFWIWILLKPMEQQLLDIQPGELKFICKALRMRYAMLASAYEFA